MPPNEQCGSCDQMCSWSATRKDPPSLLEALSSFPVGRANSLSIDHMATFGPEGFRPNGARRSEAVELFEAFEKARVSQAAPIALAQHRSGTKGDFADVTLNLEITAQAIGSQIRPARGQLWIEPAGIRTAILDNLRVFQSSIAPKR